MERPEKKKETDPKVGQQVFDYIFEDPPVIEWCICVGSNIALQSVVKASIDLQCLV
jgi:hypothetical protein